MLPDTTLDAARNGKYGMIVLAPGGRATRLEADPRLIALVKNSAVRPAHCRHRAAPKAPVSAGIFKANRHLLSRCFDPAPWPRAPLENFTLMSDAKVITHGTAMDFALQPISLLAGQKQRDQVETGLRRPPKHPRSADADWKSLQGRIGRQQQRWLRKMLFEVKPRTEQHAAAFKAIRIQAGRTPQTVSCLGLETEIALHLPFPAGRQ